MSTFYKDLKAGLEDIIAHKQGKLDLRTMEIEIPEPPAKYDDKETSLIS